MIMAHVCEGNIVHEIISPHILCIDEPVIRRNELGSESGSHSGCHARVDARRTDIAQHHPGSVKSFSSGRIIGLQGGQVHEGAESDRRGTADHKHGKLET